LNLKVCLRAGVILKVYEKFVKDIEVVEVPLFEDVVSEEAPVFDSEAAMVEYARGGFFVRDLKRNLVFCPGGEKLRFCGSSRRAGVMLYRNKVGCERCLVKCCGAKFLVARFGGGKWLLGVGLLVGRVLGGGCVVRLECVRW
jgi:transposase